MKTRNKLGVLSVLAATAILAPWNVKAETNTMPTAVDGKITLTEDVTLTSAAWVNTGDVTIDLNGYTLKRSGYYGYLINNSAKNAKLTITDSKGTGSIVCEQEPGNPANPSSCIRNNGTMEVNGVKNIDAEFHALKNEEESTLIVKGSNIVARSTSAAGIHNWGTLTVEDSVIEGSKDPQGAAIFSLSWNGNGAAYSSSSTIKNSTLDAYWPIIIQHAGVTIEGETIKVNVENSTLKQVGGLARVQGVNGNTEVPTINLELAGDITASSFAIVYAKEGTTLTLNEDLTEDITVPAGMTLIVPEGIEVGDHIISVEDGAKVENKTSKNISVTLIGEENKTIIIEPGKDSVNPTTPVEPSNPVEPTEPTTPTEPETPENPGNADINTPDENPKTLDGVYSYAAVGLVSVASLVTIVKKKLN